MKTLIIPIHSFVDIITNSSSEIFCTPSKNTIKAIKEMLDNVLKAGGSKLESKDLFQIDITRMVSREVNKKYVEEFYTEAEIKACIKEGKFEKEDVEGSEYEEELGDSEENVKTYVRVKPLIDSPEAVKAAKTLSDLTGLFEIEDRCDY